MRTGDVTPDAALEQIKSLPFEDLGFAKVDHHRALRVGVPEVIFGPGKAPEHFVEIFDRLAERGNNVLATRVSEEQVAGDLALLPAGGAQPVGADAGAAAKTREAAAREPSASSRPEPAIFPWPKRPR